VHERLGTQKQIHARPELLLTAWPPSLSYQHTSVGEDDTMVYAISEMQGWRISECGGVAMPSFRADS
jgi:hypothetical protein